MLAGVRERNMYGRLHCQAIAYLLLSFGKDSKRLFFYRRSRTFFTAFCIYLILMATISNLISLAAIENK